MASVKIPMPLRQYTGHEANVTVHGSTVGEALDDLLARCPELRPHLFAEGNQVQGFVNIFIGEDDIRYLQDLDTPIDDQTRLRIVPSVAGG